MSSISDPDETGKDWPNYHRHDSGDVVQGAAARCIDPDAGAHDVVVLTRAGLGGQIVRLLDEHWPNNHVNGWLLTDLLVDSSSRPGETAGAHPIPAERPTGADS